MDFPIPDFGDMAVINSILNHATDWLSLLGDFVWLCAGFYLVVKILPQLVKVLRDPPQQFK